ncbi:MAG: hypothetical protein ACRDTF_11460, partial [Pseudonocardiaceae bacterium]
DRSCTYARTLDQSLGVPLSTARNRIDDLVRNLKRNLRFATAPERAISDSSSALGRVPQCLVALAVQVLPIHERPRYRQEFSVELMELPRQERLRYALRVLTRAWELRSALTETVDGAPARPAGW